MNCQQLLDRLENSNISVGVVDGKLRILDPDKNLSEDLLLVSTSILTFM